MDVLIVGAGLAGLACATRLHQAGKTVRIFEAAEHVGGRVRTDRIDGFQLDRGFQVYLTAYPDARHVLDLPTLQLHSFQPGALIRYAGKFHYLVDPWRSPRHLWATIMSPVASLSDKWKVARLRAETRRSSPQDWEKLAPITTAEALQLRGFSPRVFRSFFQPFLGGVFLDPSLMTSQQLLYFVFKMFAEGDAALPTHGMQAIPQLLCDALPADAVRLGAPVTQVTPGSVTLVSGETVRGNRVVVATERPAMERLLPSARPGRGQSVGCFYYAADQPPVKEPILVLNGEGQGPINNLCVPSQVAPSYAPAGRALVSVTTFSQDAGAEPLLRRQLTEWFGEVVSDWTLLRHYQIDYALPDQSPSTLANIDRSMRDASGVFLCGDHLDTGSINGAIRSGWNTAEAVLRS